MSLDHAHTIAAPEKHNQDKEPHATVDIDLDSLSAQALADGQNMANEIRYRGGDFDLSAMPAYAYGRRQEMDLEV